METFLKVFGDVKLITVIELIVSLGFLVSIYIKIRKYLTDRYKKDLEKDKQFQEVVNQVQQYPKWRQQSCDIQAEFRAAIDRLTQAQEMQMRKLEQMEANTAQLELNKCRDRLLQSYRYYTSSANNPMHAWTEMEADAFWRNFGDYEKLGGNGYMHTVVEPAMRELELISMGDLERVGELMYSRK